MDIIRSFNIAFKNLEEKGWSRIYVLVDIHDTIFEACYYNNEEYKWFPFAKESLDIMSSSNRISLILWSSTYLDKLRNYLEFFKKNGIRFDQINKNAEENNTSLSCFDEKPYFNVGIDDKFGFDGENDWKIIYDFLVEGIRVGKIR